MKLNIVLAIMGYIGLIAAGFYAGTTSNFIVGLSLGFFISSIAIFFQDYYRRKKK